MGSPSGGAMLRGLDTMPGAPSGAGLLVALWLLACVGSVEIVTTGRIFAGLRAWLLASRVPSLGRLASCPMCLGFWAGAAWCMLGLFPVLAVPRVVRWFAAGCASSGACWSWHVVLCRLGAREL
jgi:hypothetical protein